MHQKVIKLSLFDVKVLWRNQIIVIRDDVLYEDVFFY